MSIILVMSWNQLAPNKRDLWNARFTEMEIIMLRVAEDQHETN